MRVIITAEMACEPKEWMYAGPFEDRFEAVEIVQPDRIVFTCDVESTEDSEVDGLVYDIEDHFNELDVDYMDINPTFIEAD